MADKKKEEVPEHISKFYKLTKKARQMLQTMERHHRGAYDKAIDDVLTKEGQVDMDLLENQENQDKFANKMADHYISKAKGLFRVKDEAKFDDLEKELLINAYAGTTKAKLLGLVRSHGKGFTFDHFYGEEKPQMMKAVEENLSAATASHFKDKHIEDIVKYTKSGDFVDKGKIDLPHAVRLLGEFETYGVVRHKAHEKAPYYKKKK